MLKHLDIRGETYWSDRSSHPEVISGKGVLKTCSKFTEEHTCRSVISVKLQSNFVVITLRHGFSLVNVLHIFRTPFPKITSEQLLLVRCDDKASLTLRCDFPKGDFLKMNLSELINFYSPSHPQKPKDFLIVSAEIEIYLFDQNSIILEPKLGYDN